MANAVVAHQRFGPETYNTSLAATGANAITGGKLVTFDGTTGTVKLSTAGSFIGVALYDALPTNNLSSTDAVGAAVFSYVNIPVEVAIAYVGTFLLVNGDGTTLTQGTIVYAGANGNVSATVSGRAVGIVINPGGIATTASGFVRLFN